LSNARRAALALAAFTLPLAAQTPRTKPVTQAEVDKITRDAILIDTHDDVPSKTVDGMTSPRRTNAARRICRA